MKLGGILALSAALVLTGCATEPPPVSDKVQQYYDENVAGNKATFAPTGPAVTVVFIGDSYTSGTGAANPLHRWTTKLSEDLGWSETNLGNGGTGYFNQGGTTNYAGVVQEAVDANPAVVVVSGGRNDVGFGAQRFTPAVADFFSALRGGLPNATVIVTSPIYDDDAGPDAVAELAAAVKANAEAAGATYVDIGEPLLGHPELVAADGVHPNDAGHAAIYAAVRQAVAAAPGIRG